MASLNPKDPLLSLRDVTAELGLSAATIYRHVAARTFPEPTRIGKNVRWRRSTIEALKGPRPVDNDWQILGVAQ